jgi:hypothetical protein
VRRDEDDQFAFAHRLVLPAEQRADQGNVSDQGNLAIPDLFCVLDESTDDDGVTVVDPHQGRNLFDVQHRGRRVARGRDEGIQQAADHGGNVQRDLAVIGDLRRDGEDGSNCDGLVGDLV